LVREGRSLSIEERAELLRKALQHDDVDVVEALLEIGADPNAAYYGTHTPPLMMVRTAAAARALIDAGACPFVRNDNGGTPLGWAAHLAPDVTALLLKAGVQVDQPAGSDARTALWQAACGGNAGVVKLLLDAGASPALRPGAMSALDCARQQKANARLQRPPVLAPPAPFVADFDGVIALLEQALANRR
jgi:ankyrin repeat protein